MAVWGLPVPTTSMPLPFPAPSLSLSQSSFGATRTSSNILPISSVSRVAYLENSNALLVKSSNFNVQITVEEDEPEDKLISRFRKEVLRARVLQECRRRRFFETTQDKIKRKSREAARSYRNRRPHRRAPVQNKDKSLNKEKDDDEEDDNWELPDVDDLPYT